MLSACAAFAASVSLPSIAAADAAPSAQAYYEAAVAHMKALPQPAFATYTTQIHAYGANLDVLRKVDDGGLEVALMIGGHGTKDRSYPVAVRNSDNATSLEFPDETHAVSHSAFVNPTWGGAYDTMRYGWQGPLPAMPAPASATPEPAATPIPVIAIVTAISPGFYRVEDAGAASCENGAAGHRVHLVARRDPREHPLTDAVIDVRTQQFCSLTFAMRQTGIVGATGAMVLNFGNYGPYQLVSDSHFDLELRAFGVGVKRLGARMTFTDFAFPASVPDARFVREKGAAPKPAATPAA